MYKDNSQLWIEDFVFPARKLDAETDNSDDGNDPLNSGTLVVDAACCPADIAYPQDSNLLSI